MMKQRERIYKESSFVRVAALFLGMPNLQAGEKVARSEKGLSERK